MEQPIKILLLEDSTTDAEIIQRLLMKQETHYEFHLAMNKKSFLLALQEFSPDVILSDNSLPGFNAADALKIAHQQLPHIPFILVTGMVSEEFAANIIKEGSDDYILKDRMVRLPGAIDAALKQRRSEKEKQETIKKLIESEEKYRTIFLKSPLSNWIFDAETFRILDVNETAILHYGYTRKEFLSMTIKDIRPKEDVGAYLNNLEKNQNSSNTLNGNWRHQKKNGEVIIVETTAHSIDYNGRKARMVVANDITAKIRSEAELRRSEMRLNEAQAITHISNWEIDLVNNIHTWSDEVYKIYGLNKADTIPSIELFQSFFHPDDRVIVKKITDTALKDFTESKIDFRFITASKIKRYGHIEWRFEFDKGMPVRFFGILQDITESKEAAENLKLLEENMLEQKIQQQKKIARAIITGQEKERNHIGKELHDNINQILAGAKIYLSIAGKKGDAIKEIIKYPMELIDKSINEIRLLCSKLVTPLKNIKLEEMVRELLSKLNQNTNSKTNLTYSVSSELSDDLKLNIYRIIQELINNILKYAEAKNVNITIRTEGKVIHIGIEDDGKGFDIKMKRKGIGILNVMNRVETFNGEVKIKSSSGKGCKINIEIPLLF